MTSSAGMWGGRFAAKGGGDADAVFRALNDSLPVDWRMVRHDITGSIAWARALSGVGIYNESELAQVIDALGAIAEHAATLEAPPIDSGAEDVHTWVEQQLTERTGDLGKRLHTGRSRNDQVATDLRLWVQLLAEGAHAFHERELHP
ncbi:MAG: lyase family protein [Planctomycetota bacterium]